MRIAVTYDNGNIFQHFGRTEYFKIYDIINNKVERSIIISSNGFGHSELGDLLLNNNVNSLICGGIGDGALNILKEHNIKVYAGVTGNADEAIELLLKNKLIYQEQSSCDHKDENSFGHHDCNCK